MDENGSTTDHWDVFEQAYDRAQERYDDARQRYQRLANSIGGLPDEYATALTGAEEELEQLDDVLDVTREDAERATDLVERLDITADALGAMATFCSELQRVELSIYEDWHAALEETDGVDVSLVGDTISDLWASVHRENYEELSSGGDSSLSGIRLRLHEADETARQSLSATDYVAYCLDASETFTNELTDDLKRLVQNEVPVRIKDDRKPVTDVLESAEEALDADEIDEKAVQNARAGRVGTMMLRYQVAYARCAHEYCTELSEILADTGVADRELERLSADREVTELEQTVVSAIAQEATIPLEERITNVLRENDRSLTKALQASDFDRSEFFEALETAYDAEHIVDIEVHFE